MDNYSSFYLCDEKFDRMFTLVFDLLVIQALNRHWLAYAERECDSAMVINPGNLHWRDGGEKHMNDPLTIGNLQVTYYFCYTILQW